MNPNETDMSCACVTPILCLSLISGWVGSIIEFWFITFMKCVLFVDKLFAPHVLYKKIRVLVDMSNPMCYTATFINALDKATHHHHQTRYSTCQATRVHKQQQWICEYSACLAHIKDPHTFKCRVGNQDWCGTDNDDLKNTVQSHIRVSVTVSIWGKFGIHMIFC